MGNGTQPEQAPAPKKPELPKGVPADLRAYLECTPGASATLPNGSLNWLSIRVRDFVPPDAQGSIPDKVLDATVHPEITITEDPSAPGRATIKLTVVTLPLFGPIGPEFSASISDGTLTVDTSGVPIQTAKDQLDAAVMDLNAWFKANGKGFAAPVFGKTKDGKPQVTLSKVALAAAPKSAPAPLVPPPVKAPEVPKAPASAKAPLEPRPAITPVPSGTSKPAETPKPELPKDRSGLSLEVRRHIEELRLARDKALDNADLFNRGVANGDTMWGYYDKAQAALEEASRQAGITVPDVGEPFQITPPERLGEPPILPPEDKVTPRTAFPPAPEQAMVAPRDGGGIDRRLVAVGVGVAIVAIAAGAFALNGGFGSSNQVAIATGTPITTAAAAAPATETPTASATSQPTALPTPTPVAPPPEAKAVLADLKVDQSVIQNWSTHWTADPGGDLMTLEGKTATYSPQFADISGWAALLDDNVKPGALDFIAGQCGQTTGGVQVVCGAKTAAAVKTAKSALFVIETVGESIPSNFPTEDRSTCGSGICLFSAPLYVDRDGNVANNLKVPAGQPYALQGNSDGEFVTATKSGKLIVSFTDLVPFSNNPTNAFIVVSDKAIGWVILDADIPKMFRGTTQAIMAAGGTTAFSVDIWGGFPPAGQPLPNYSAQQAMLFWGGY